MKEFEINILSDYDNVAHVNDAVRDFLSNQGVESYILNAFDICLTEALNNIIKHAYKEENGREIIVKLRKDTKVVEVEIIDEGQPRTKFEIPNLDFDPQDINNLPESGMGLFIMNQLMDELKYENRDGKNYFLLKKWLY
ncbi:MAG: ATP-binding protein [Bacteroidota bacterium]